MRLHYENSGEFIGHYVSYLREWGRDHDATFGEHYVPHDGDRQSLWLEDGTLAVMDKLGFRPNVVERPAVKASSINAARTKIAQSQFDEVGTAVGLKRLKAYRKDWDDLRGVWKDKPRHDDASHGADGYQTFACSDYEPPKPVADRSRYRGGSSQSTSWMGQ